MYKIKIEIKVILGIIFFTLFVVGLNQYELSENIIRQFKESKKSKNQLLIHAIIPVVTLDLSLGLLNADKEYLHVIVKQNKDIKNMQIVDRNHKIIFKYPQNLMEPIKKEQNSIDDISSPIVDNLTRKKIGDLYIAFYSNDYNNVIAQNTHTTVKIFFITLLLLMVFVSLIKKEFKPLRSLTEHMLNYNPKENTLSLNKSNRLDEIGMIHNTFIEMARRINDYTKRLDDINASLEDKIQARTDELQKMNERLEKLSIQDALTLNEKNILLKELYHRVKNNLQIISSSLILQSRRIKDSTIQKIFNEATQRIKAMAMVHEKLYQANDLALVDMQMYTQELVENLWQAYSDTKLHFEVKCENVKLDLEKALPIGLIINELVANSMKYAFDQTFSNKKIFVRMYSIHDEKFILEISDNGKGADFQTITQGFGFKLVESLASYQLKGTIDFFNQNGLHYKLEFFTEFVA